MEALIFIFGQRLSKALLSFQGSTHAHDTIIDRNIMSTYIRRLLYIILKHTLDAAFTHWVQEPQLGLVGVLAWERFLLLMGSGLEDDSQNCTLAMGYI